MISASEVISIVYESFHETGEWPRVGELQVRLRDVGHVSRIAAEIGWENAVCEDVRDGECYLTLKGIEQCPDASEDISNYLALVRLLASEYITKGPGRVTSDTVQRELGVNGVALRRLYEITRRESGIWTGCGHSHDWSEYHLEATNTIAFFENVSTLEDYWAVKDRIAEEEKEANRLKSGPPPAWDDDLLRDLSIGSASEISRSSVSLYDAELQKLVESDLLELEQVIAARAWKATAVLAGSCVEAVLLDLWKRRESAARERFGTRWPKHVGAYELAEAAADEGFLSQDHRDLVATVRRWRNLIHPLAALRGKEPRKEIAEALVAVLKLLLADVARRET